MKVFLNTILFISIILSSCSVFDRIENIQNNDYYNHTLEGWGDVTYIIVLPIEINDTVYNLLTTGTSMIEFLDGSYSKVKRRLYHCMKYKKPIELTDYILEYDIAFKVIRSYKVDSIYDKGFNFFIQYYLDIESHELKKDIVVDYTTDELFYIYSILFHHKYYVFSNGYNEIEVYKDYPKELTNNLHETTKHK